MPTDIAEHHAAIATAHGFDLYRTYAEKQAAEFLKISISKLKLERKNRNIGFVLKGARSAEYFGYHLVNYFLTNEVCPDTQPKIDSKSARTGFQGSPEAQHGVEPGTMPLLSKQDELASALRILTTPNSN